MGQIADQRQRDRRDPGAQPVLRGLAQVRRHKPHPGGQAQHTTGQQQLQVLVVGSVKRFHPGGDVRPCPLGHGGVHHTGTNTQQLTPERLRRPGRPADAPGRAAIGAPIIVEYQ